MVMARQSLLTVFFLIIAASLSSHNHVHRTVFVTAATNNNRNKSSPFPAFVKRWRKRMGNIVRMMSYDIAGNEKNAVPALNFLNGQQPLQWFRLDDGVMGGQSESNHTTTTTSSNIEDTTGGLSVLDFCGTINTNGGGFCSIRASLLDGGLPANTKGIRIRYSGDGKTYKFLMSDGTRGFSTPSWQHDIVTSADNKEEQDIEIKLDDLKASMGPRLAPNNLQFNVTSIKEIGFMLSLKLSDGSPNPVETFGTGIFPFSLKIHSIEPIVEA